VSEINRIAERFLREYLDKNPSVEFNKVMHAMRLCATEYYDEAAEDFLTQVQSEYAERLEISEPTSVIISRACPRSLPAFLAGVRREKLIWTYHQHLAHVFQRNEASAVSKMLEAQSIPNYSLPALVWASGCGFVRQCGRSKK
jgi:hypothetical protein